MNMRDLIPWGRDASRPLAPQTGGDGGHPFLTLHREINRLFDDAFSRFDRSFPMSFGASAWPSVEISEADGKLRVTAEVPGLNEKDIELLVEDDELVLRGEKRSESEDKNRRFSERYYGRFERRIALPYEIDDSKVEASFANGVLTVTLPKSPKAEARSKRIAISTQR